MPSKRKTTDPQVGDTVWISHREPKVLIVAMKGNMHGVTDYLVEFPDKSRTWVSAHRIIDPYIMQESI